MQFKNKLYFIVLLSQQKSTEPIKGLWVKKENVNISCEHEKVSGAHEKECPEHAKLGLSHITCCVCVCVCVCL